MPPTATTASLPPPKAAAKSGQSRKPAGVQIRASAPTRKVEKARSDARPRQARSAVATTQDLTAAASDAEASTLARHILAAPGLFTSSEQKTRILLQIVHDALDEQLARVVAPDRADDLRAALLADGKALIARLATRHRASLLTARQVAGEFQIPFSTLHRNREAGSVIGIPSEGSRHFLFPREQFLPVVTKEFPDLPRRIIERVGNGYAGFHALYAERTSLGGLSLAEALEKAADTSSLSTIRELIAGFEDSDFG